MTRQSTAAVATLGADTGTPVANDYQVPFQFSGKLKQGDTEDRSASAIDIGHREVAGNTTKQQGTRIAEILAAVTALCRHQADASGLSS